MPNFRNQHPNDIITRAMILQEIRTIPPALILQLPKEFHNFVKGQDSIILTGKGDKASKASIDWEYALFEATNTKLISLINHFNKKPKDEKAS